jgi:hypothetical protein
VALEAPEASDEAVDLDLVTAQGGRHRLVGHGWLSYALLLLTPLGLAVVITVLTSLPSRPYARPWANEATTPGALPLVPTPAPAPTSALPSPHPTASGSASAAAHPPKPGDSTGASAVTLLAPDNPGSAAATTNAGTDLLLVLEAENGLLGGDLQTSSAPGASGGVVVLGLGTGRSQTVTFTGVRVAATDSYLLSLYYATAGVNSLTVRTSAGGTAVVPCLASFDGRFRTAAVTVVLARGANTITVEATSPLGLQLDRIELA